MRNRGMTLIEVILSLGLLAGLSGTVLPCLGGLLHEARLDRAAAETLGAFRRARDLARYHQRPVELSISLQGQRLALAFVNDDGGREAIPGDRAILLTEGLTPVLVGHSFPGGLVIFDALGLASSAGQVDLADAGLSRLVVLDDLVGQAELVTP